MKIQFEGTTHCNARCTFCPRYDMTRQMGEMSDELFHKIIKDGKAIKHSFFVPFLNGEPFVFSRIWKWLDYMQKENVPVHIYTNAELLDVDRILKYKNIRLICCSINAATKETHKKIMRGPDFDVVTKNVKELIKKAKLPAGVWASFVEVEDNIHEKEMFQKQWGENAIFGEFKNWGGARHDKLERTGERTVCYSSTQTMSILWDGRAVVCCLDYDGKLVLGDVNKQTLTEIWHKSRWLRNKHKRLDYSMTPCRDCNQNIK